MTFKLPKIYPIVDAASSVLPVNKQLRALIDGGAEFIQLRNKNGTSREFFFEAREALAIAGEKNIRIIVNDRVDVALTVKAHGVHLGQDDLPPRDARKLLGEKFALGYSTHNLAQALEAIEMPVDYIAVGPIFATRTKKNPDPEVGLDGLKLIRQAIGDFPLVAIGGINTENAVDVFTAGADSVALIGALVGDENQVTQNFRRLNEL